MTPRAKSEIALSELDRVRAAGVRFGTVLADAGHGASAAFRHGLDARGLLWAVGIPKNQKVHGTDVQLVPPAGRARKLVPGEEPRAAGDVLAERPWRRVTWRQGTKGPLSAKFAATRIRVARWVCEQAHQQPKGELGLGHFEGRPWTGLHRHALMTCIACTCLQCLRRAGHRRTGWGKTWPRNPGPPPSPSPPALRRAIIGKLFTHLAPPVQCPHCRHQCQLMPDPKCPDSDRWLEPNASS